MIKHFVRCGDLDAREIDDDIFLIDEDDGAIYHLNSTGAAVWRILEKPRSKRDITALICAVFPLEDPQNITNAITKILKQLRKKKLIERK